MLTAKKCYFRGLLLGTIGLLLSQTGSLACGLRLTEPKSHFDGVDALGNVNLIEKLGQLDLGKTKLPIYLVFNSDNTRVSPYVGSSFDIPLLSSRIVAIDENTFKFYEPDGWYQTFWRDSKDPSILNGGSGWKAEIKGDTISAWANCGGSKATFVKGKITELEVNGTRLNYVYNGDQVSEIRNGGSSLLKILTNSNTGEVTGLSLGMNNTVTFTLGQKPRVQNIGGKNLISAVERSLSQVVLADGAKHDFAFAVDDQIRPTLKVDGSHQITWDPASFKMIKDNNWSYDAKPIVDNGANALITRTNSAGQKESWMYDGVKGEEVTQVLDGSSRRRRWFTSGVLSGRPRDETKVKDGKETLLNSWTYDENGRLIRSYVLMNAPHNFTYMYNEGGKTSQINVDGKTWLTKQYDDKGRLAVKTFSNGVKEVFNYTPDGIKDTVTDKVGKVIVKNLDATFRMVTDAGEIDKKSDTN